MIRQSKRHAPETEIAAPPRKVPLSVRLRIMTGGSINLFGWVFFGFGMIFVWVFGGAAVLNNLVYMSGQLAEAEAGITSIEATNTTVNGTRIHDYYYEFEVDGIVYSGSSEAAGGWRYKVDSTVTVEYSVSNPSRSRIKGVETFRWVGLIAGIFPFFGLIIISFGIRKGIKGTHLLRDGIHTYGKCLSRTARAGRDNSKTQYNFIFQYKALDQKLYKISVQTDKPELFAGEDVQRPEIPADDPDKYAILEPLLYNPQNPDEALLLDDLPGEPRFDERGAVKGMIGGAIFSLLIPGFVILAHTLVFLFVVEIL